MKLFIGLLGLMLIAAGVSWWAWRSAPLPEPCESRDLSRSVSPDGRALAEVFEQWCGESVATHVSLRPAAAPIQSRSDVFIAAGVASVRLEWNQDRELVVESPAHRVLVQETAWRNVGVRVRLIR